MAALCLAVFRREDLVAMTAIAFGASALNILVIGPMLNAPQARVAISIANFLENIKFGLKVFVSRQELIVLSILSCVINLVMGMTLAQAAPLIVGYFGRTEQFFGGMTTLAAIASIVTFTQIPRIAARVSITMLGFYSLLGLLVAGTLLGAARDPFVFAIGYAFLMTSCAVFNVFMRTWRARIIPKEHMGKVVGILVLINNSTLPLSGAIVAGFAPSVGSQNLILVAAGTLAISAAAYLNWIRVAKSQLIATQN